MVQTNGISPVQNVVYLAYKFVFGFEAGLTRLVKVRIVTNSSAAEGWIPTCKANEVRT
jgi:hypothetical protein